MLFLRHFASTVHFAYTLRFISHNILYVKCQSYLRIPQKPVPFIEHSKVSTLANPRNHNSGKSSISISLFSPALQNS